MDTVEVLEEAKALLLMGYCTGAYMKEAPRWTHYCALGAIAKASGLGFKEYNGTLEIADTEGNFGTDLGTTKLEAWQPFLKALDAVESGLGDRLFRWSDEQKDRRKVIALFDKIINKLKEQ